MIYQFKYIKVTGFFLCFPLKETGNGKENPRCYRKDDNGGNKNILFNIFFCVLDYCVVAPNEIIK